MRKIKLVIQYVGSRYCGWQVQPNGLTIQAILQDLLEKTLGEKTTVIGAGRTDSGVHALGQVAHFKTSHSMDLETLHRALNAQLPEDIAVLAAEEVDADFHAQKNATAKTYLYLILVSRQKNPFLRPYAWRLFGEFNQSAMRQCLEMIVGAHDFKAFCAADGGAKTSTRHIYSARLQVFPLSEMEHQLVKLVGLGNFQGPLEVLNHHHPDRMARLWALSFRGNGFLKHMVRNLVGTIVEVGQGKRSVEEFQQVLAGKDRRQAGPTAPPQGLFLLNVEYPE
jgi:tRNA pseudouridine38-40 synthase